MSCWLRQSTQVIARLGPFLDRTDAYTEEAGLAGTGTEISKNHGAFGAGPVLGTHDSDGWYPITLTTSHTDTLGCFIVKCHDNATHLPVWREFEVVNTALFDAVMASSGGAIPNAVAGAAGGLQIAGSNAATTYASLTVTAATTLTGNVALADGLTIAAPSTAGRAGLSITGNGAGAGAIITGGATGNGVTISAGATSGHGIISTATGTSFNGLRVVGSPTTGEGFRVLGGSTSGDGIGITTVSGHAISAVATGTTKHGIVATGGATTSDGIIATGGGVGMGIRAVGGGGAAAHGIQVTGGSASGNGINITTTSGHAISAVATGTTAHGIHAVGGATTSHGINAVGGGVGNGIQGTSGGGATGDGINATSIATNGNGMRLIKTGSGSDLNATVTPLVLAKTTNITGFNDIAATSIVSAGAITTLAGAVANVDLVDVLTTYTGNTVQSGDAFARIGLNGASLTALGDARIANLDATVSSRSTVTTGQVNAEVVDALNVDTYAEPGQATPAATSTLVQKIGYLFKAWRNRTTQTATDYKLYNDDAVTVDQKATTSDDATTFDRTEITGGP